VVGRSTGAFDVRDDPTGRVPMVEAISRLALAIDAGRALCLGLGRRCFFIAYSCSLTIVASSGKLPGTWMRGVGSARPGYYGTFCELRHELGKKVPRTHRQTRPRDSRLQGAALLRARSFPSGRSWIHPASR
jgi:hypothetical protein